MKGIIALLVVIVSLVFVATYQFENSSPGANLGGNIIADGKAIEKGIEDSFSYDGKDTEAVQKVLIEAFLEEELTLSISRLKVAEEEVQLLAEEESSYTFDHDEFEAQYGSILHSSNVLGCGATYAPSRMGACILNSLDLNQVPDQIGVALRFDPLSEEMYYLIVY